MFVLSEACLGACCDSGGAFGQHNSYDRRGSSPEEVPNNVGILLLYVCYCITSVTLWILGPVP